jgi:hypothetical protein
MQTKAVRINIPVDVHAALKAKAALRKIPLLEFLIQILITASKNKEHIL